jgi:hypothetical protein
VRTGLVMVLLPFVVAAFADNPLPFFSGSYVNVQVEPDCIVLENEVYRRVISADLRTISLVNHGQEVLAEPRSEGVLYQRDGSLDLAGSTITDVAVESARDSKIVRVSATKDGFDFVICYRVFAGDRPWMAKWFEFPEPVYLDRVTIECFRFGSAYVNGTYGAWGDNGKVVGGAGYACGIQVNAPRPIASCSRSDCEVRAELRLAPPVQSTEEAVLALCLGTRYTAAFALQLYWGAYIAHATMSNRPVVYNTWYGYKWWVTEADCLRVMPIAAELGCDIFVVDDGWQDGKYGDWNVSQSRFPSGFAALGAACRQHGMEFGFWLAPALTSTSASTYDLGQIVKNADMTCYSPWGGHHVNCFSTDWADWITQHTLNLVQESGATFMKLDFDLECDACYDPTHPHPAGGAMPSQVRNWRDVFVAALRAHDEGFHVYRAQSRGESSEYNDFAWYSDWVIAAYDDPRRQDPRWWYRSADSTRYAGYYSQFLTPNWCRQGTTPAHLPGLENELDALEYNITSVCAYFCNLEFSNPLDGITPEEVALCKKWIKWFRENQEYLAYTQCDATTVSCYNPWNSSLFGSEWVDGVYHLRPKLRGKWGYLCFWNPSEETKNVTVDINPSDYFLPGELTNALLHALNAGWTRPNSASTLHVRFDMAPLSWEIIEVLDPERPHHHEELMVSGRVLFGGLIDGSVPPNEVVLRINGPDGAEERPVRLGPDGSYRVVTDVGHGQLTVSCKHEHWLRRTVAVDVEQGDVSHVDLLLTNGDANGDNFVDLPDLVLVLQRFGTDDARADLDEDGTVAVNDLRIVLSNINVSGDH